MLIKSNQRLELSSLTTGETSRIFPFAVISSILISGRKVVTIGVLSSQSLRPRYFTRNVFTTRIRKDPFNSTNLIKTLHTEQESLRFYHFIHPWFPTLTLPSRLGSENRVTEVSEGQRSPQIGREGGHILFPERHLESEEGRHSVPEQSLWEEENSLHLKFLFSRKRKNQEKNRELTTEL